MLIEKDSYKRNKKSGEIVKRQIVSLECDDCGKEWDSLFDYRKRKKLKKDLCKSCRSKFNLISQEPLNKRRWSNVDSRINVVCSFCEKNIKKFPSHIHKNGNNFCGVKCRDKHILSKYDILYDTFEKNVDEVAYLFGLILGDGHLKKTQKYTTRVDIAFNSKEVKMIELAQDIMSKLKISFYPQLQKNCNCIHLGFVLPDNLLEKYRMLWNGSKFNAQPEPNGIIMDNINFIAGLINSDGWCGNILNRKNLKKITFCNTVLSIVESFKQSLEKNRIDYKCYHRDGVVDKRTKKKNREQWMISIHRKMAIEKLIGECFYNLKEFKI